MTEPIDVTSLRRRVTQLPPLPEAVMAVMQALQRDDLSAQHSVELIERDQALAARTLRLANSAFYGVPGRVGSIGDAVRMLGLRTVAGVLTAAAMHSSLRVDACPGFCFESYWRHALGTALLARSLAPSGGLNADEAFLAGLMHDVGLLVLAVFQPDAAVMSIKHSQEQDAPLYQAEQEILGIAHPAVGALVANHWHFPAAISQAIAHHHAPLPPGPGERISLSSLVQIADALTHALDLNQDDHEAVPVIDEAAWQVLGWRFDDALALLASTESALKELCANIQAA